MRDERIHAGRKSRGLGERKSLRQVRQRVTRYVREGVLYEQPGGTTEVQTIAWQQGFCVRAALSYRPYTKESNPGGTCLGSIFSPISVADM